MAKTLAAPRAATNSFTPVDVYQIVNAAARAMFGADTTIQAIDTSTFVSVGETMLRTGYENTLNALSLVIGRTIIASRPYQGRYHLINRYDNEFGAIQRKISFFYDETEASEDWNTDLNPEQLYDGKSIDHYTIRKRYPLEMNFIGIKVLQKHYTTFRKQLKIAFRNEREFAEFFQGMLIEVNNELELIRETESNLLVLNHIASTYYQAQNGMPGMAVNLTAGYNELYGTTYTSAELRTTYAKEFLAYVVETIKLASLKMRRATVNFHMTPTKTTDTGNQLYLLRHTPRDKQRLFLYAPFMIASEARVLPEVFNDRYLKIENYESVEYWQDINDPSSVSVTGATTGADGISTSTGEVKIPYIVGMLFDEDALAINFGSQDVLTTPINAAGDYYNTYYHWRKSYNDDPTENSILFYMEDPATEG